MKKHLTQLLLFFTDRLASIRAYDDMPVVSAPLCCIGIILLVFFMSRWPTVFRVRQKQTPAETNRDTEWGEKAGRTERTVIAAAVDAGWINQEFNHSTVITGLQTMGE